MLNNIKFIWKFTLLAALIPIAALIMAATGLLGAGSVKAEYDNLYSFMLIPIYNLEEANLHLKDLDQGLEDLRKPNLDDAERSQIISRIQNSDEQMRAVMTRYQEEWISTGSVMFTESLAKLGKSSLQDQEAEALAQFNEAYEGYASEREDILSGTFTDLEDLNTDFAAMNASMDTLLEVNLDFAALSNDSAQSTIQQMRRQIISAGVLISLLGMGFAGLLTLAVVKPLAAITQAAGKMAVGDLDNGAANEGRERLNGMKDEIGELARSLLSVREYQFEMAAAAKRIAQGDLTVEIRPKSAQDELGIAFSDMIARLIQMVSQISSSAAGVAGASGNLTAAADQAGQATGQIAATIQEVARGTTQQAESVVGAANTVEQVNRAIAGVARGAQEQSEAVTKTAALTSQIASAVDQVSKNAQAGVAGSQRAASVAAGGAQQVADAAAGMNSIKAKVDASSQKVKEMGQRSEQIGVIVELIDEIAGQTNLLALNAAIEAARAGEHGKGFAVVADEVRKLAERAGSAAKEISGLISDIQNISAEAVRSMNEGAGEVENGVLQAKRSGQSLADVLAAVNAVHQQIEQIGEAARKMGALTETLVASSDAVSAVVEENTAAAEQMTAASSEVTRSIENIASVSEENSAALEEVSASAEEMTAQVEEVTASTQSLADMADALQQVVAQFRLPEQAVEAVRQPSLPATSNGLRAQRIQPGKVYA